LLSKNIKNEIFKTVIFACYYIRVCETWSLTSREEHRLRVFENRVLRKIFCPKREQVAEEWCRLHNEELRELYSSANIIWLIKLRRVR
jgi:hypothetical protein